MWDGTHRLRSPIILTITALSGHLGNMNMQHCVLMYLDRIKEEGDRRKGHQGVRFSPEQLPFKQS